jgi:hypothetical protein
MDTEDRITDIDQSVETPEDQVTPDPPNQGEDDRITGNEPESDTESDSQTTIPDELALGGDSTAALAVITQIEEDEGDQLGDSDIIDEVDDFLNPETEFDSDEEKLEAGHDLLRRYFSQHNRSWSAVLGTFAGYAVDIGRILHELKALVKACGKKWEPWAAENLVFMKPRTRQAFMQLAAVPGIDGYLHLCKERLLLLDSATKPYTSDDPIGDFLKRHDLYFDPEAEIDLDAYKEAVDIALDHDRLKNAGVVVEKDSIRKYKMDGKKIDASLIKVLKAVQKSTGDPNKSLTDPLTDDDDDSGEKRVQSFKKLAVSLLGTIAWIVGHPDYLDQVEADKIDELEEKLGALKRLISPSNPDDEE